MSLDRRDFLKLCTGTVAGLGVSQMVHPAIVRALEKATSGKAPVFWLQGCGCTGCSVSILNSVHPTIADVLLKVISMDFHPTLMGAEGEMAMEHMFEVAKAKKGQYFVVLEGAIPTADERYCIIGDVHHKEISINQAMLDLGKDAAACIALGSCGAYGGIPAAKGNLTGCVGLRDFYQSKNISTPVVNIPGCPPHPDWIIGSLAFALEHGVEATAKILDAEGRPSVFFGENIHDNCPYLEHFENDNFAATFTQAGCKYNLGCKGPACNSDCFKRKWNSGMNWCVENAVCTGCAEPGWPDNFSPFYESM
ncbi:NiFeSe hydrogenase small subunit [Desulfocurvibacter africanus]|uniref:NiFeSe hydrogenase small subunit n=1 Tax=Desulfocurvibacter africanus TaxID=873 RepID=UPI002FDA171F